MTLANANEDAPQPLCVGRESEYADYEGYPPSEARAAAMCAGCPFLEACGNNARQQLPVWGVWGGIAWVDRRQAHLMAGDDPRWDWCIQDVKEFKH
ncbi:WhiB family transcriptional regulator [Streptomyces sp. AC495_CC817]|uniref:WhiB family transcriptional regulator n=1 Tax=Streptomyces sp. AC495_CC817 TaxID=2823900 RepID=UPI0035A86382